MNKLKSRIQLLALFSIFFIYKAIMGILNNNLLEISLWFMITIVYIISLIILYFIGKRYQKIQITSESKV